MLKQGFLKRAALLVAVVVIAGGGIYWQAQEKNNDSAESILFKAHGKLEGNPQFLLEPIILNGDKILLVDKVQTTLQIYDLTTSKSKILAKAGEKPLRLESATLLDDRRILLTGGSYSKIFVLNKNEFYATGKMVVPQVGASVVKLNEGKILFLGGIVAGKSNKAIQAFNPETEQYALVGELVEPRSEAKAIKLQDGSILIIGGIGLEGMPQSVELYKPFEKKSMVIGRLSKINYVSTAALLDDSRVLVTGFTSLDDKNLKNRRLAEIIDLSDSTTLALENGPACSRVEAEMVKLPNNKFLLYGVTHPSGVRGADKSGVKNCTPLIKELFDPVTNKFKAIAQADSMTGGINRAALIGSKLYLLGPDFVYVYSSNKE